MGDPRVMYAWERVYTAEDVTAWMQKVFDRYETDGFCFYAAIEKKTNAFVGTIGPLWEETDNERYIGVGYILAYEQWGKGFATEGALACMRYAFDVLNASRVGMQIRTDNTRSIRVAERLGMHWEKEFIAYFEGNALAHIFYCMEKDAFLRLTRR